MLLPDVNALANVIYREIHEAGPIPFARFMELALYCPELGFYERFPHRIGRSGDYITSVSVGPLFGRLLAFKFARWLNELTYAPGASVKTVYLVEAGAHDGQLARDILTWLVEHAPATLRSLHYLILEPSTKRETWQRTTLGELVQHTAWIRDWSAVPPAGIHGVIFSNELMDAFPVHRLGWDATKRSWFEYGVALQGDRLVWCRLPLTAITGSIAPEMPDSLKATLPDGFVAEAAPGASRWWHQAAAALGRGRLVAIDYGFDHLSLLDPERPSGTLRAYRQHLQVADLLADPGEQDLTAHVNFRLLRETGESQGLSTRSLTSQARFLPRILEEIVRLKAPGFEWTRKERSQFQTLIHPDHLGERFKVLVQRRLQAPCLPAAARL
jgi:SAM-dependent MidA family methyltransferase